MNLINYFLIVAMLSLVLGLIFDHAIFPMVSMFSMGYVLGANVK